MEDLGGDERKETVINIYIYMLYEKIIFNKTKLKTK